MKEVKDIFSANSANYAAFRPESPQAVYDFLYPHVKRFDTAWDCGTGNGQVAIKLSERFTNVYGTDISADQLSHARRADNILYKLERAEATSIPDDSIDLVTIAQAIHWFDFDQFYNEVRRVSRPDGLIAAWTYSLFRLTPAINEVIDHFYTDITGPYWDKERKLVDDGYSTIPFPFDEIKAPEINIVKQFTIDQLAGFLRTWSGVKHYVDREHSDPLLIIMDDLRKAWGPEEHHEIKWPVHVRCGRIR